MDDEKIVDLYLIRDESAISETRDKYGALLRRLSYNIVKDESDAKECENDTYLQAWQSIPPHEPKGYLFPFLARIIRNLSLNHCRNRDRLKRRAYICELSREMEQCIPSNVNVEHCIDDLAFKEIINAFLEKLKPEKRKVFVCRYWYLDSIEDISKRYSMSQAKVKSILFRCRNELRMHLEKEGYSI